jgi:hypothetical protein
MSKLSSWFQKKKKPTTPTNTGNEVELSMAIYVFEEAKRLIEDPSFKKKALKGVIFFREALLAIETLLQTMPQVSYTLFMYSLVRFESSYCGSLDHG